VVDPVEPRRFALSNRWIPRPSTCLFAWPRTTQLGERADPVWAQPATGHVGLQRADAQSGLVPARNGGDRLRFAIAHGYPPPDGPNSPHLADPQLEVFAERSAQRIRRAIAVSPGPVRICGIIRVQQEV